MGREGKLPHGPLERRRRRGAGAFCPVAPATAKLSESVKRSPSLRNGLRVCAPVSESVKRFEAVAAGPLTLYKGFGEISRVLRRNAGAGACADRPRGRSLLLESRAWLSVSAVHEAYVTTVSRPGGRDTARPSRRRRRVRSVHGGFVGQSPETPTPFAMDAKQSRWFYLGAA